MSSIVLIDATSGSLTVSWPESANATHYILEYKTGDDEAFQTLSKTLGQPQARKRNLTNTTAGYYFRARPADSPTDSWITHSEPFFLLSSDDKRMDAPQVFLGGSHQSLRILWEQQGAAQYELQWRESRPGVPWSTLSTSLAGPEVRKKNLTSTHGYQFRVRDASADAASAFSVPSPTVVALGLAPAMKSLMGDSLLRGVGNALPLTECLGGKEFVLLYASAHWCGPCRQFTPQLAQWYRSLGTTSTVEVVFLSADHDETGFEKYYKEMPWLSVAHDDDRREELMGFIRVSGIPRLAVLDARTGRIIEENSVGKSLDVNRWRGLLKK